MIETAGEAMTRDYDCVDERLPLAVLAEHESVLERVVDGRDLPRFSKICEPCGGIRVRLSFSREEHGCVQIDGVLSGPLSVECHRCLEAVPVELDTGFSVARVGNDADASRLGAKKDVLVLTTDEPALAELIEDELILALPDRPCAEANCRKAPPLAYGPAALSGADNPFQSLARLKEL